MGTGSALVTNRSEHSSHMRRHDERAFSLRPLPARRRHAWQGASPGRARQPPSPCISGSSICPWVQ
eukprot:scaffold84087_cov63-Phaeocystis_antarctica.AAC.2